MNFGGCWWLVVGVTVCAGEKWRWPDAAPAPSVRIDNKVRFIDAPDDVHKDKTHREFRVQSDEVPFREPTETEGFYNRPPGAGRYPVRVEPHRTPQIVERQPASYSVHEPNLDSDGTLDSLEYCKCVSQPDCNPRGDSSRACASGKFLCCYKQPNKVNSQKSEFFNEIDDERYMLLPGQQNLARPFPPAPNTGTNGFFGPGQGHEVEILGAFDGPSGIVGPQGLAGNNENRNPEVLVGPNGPSGIIGTGQQKPEVLVGPGGPTGQIGPGNKNTGILVGPNGPRDVGQGESAQRGVLVGPGGPTGVIGPYGQRPTLFGPNGPTGLIGPNRFQRQGILVGPSGATGIIGPGYGRQAGPGILVGPGGPTGIIGPGRQILVGPGGPTGQIGPPQQRYFGK